MRQPRSPCRPARRSPALTAFVLVAVLAAPHAVPPSAALQSGGDLYLTGATIVDGNGIAGYPGEVLVRDGRILAVGRPGTLAAAAADGAAAAIDLSGLVLAPGFVDIHNHSTQRIFRDPAATTQVAQGVTTIIVGADGGSPWPIADYLDRLDETGVALNVGVMVGHGTVRGAVMGDDFRRQATAEEIEAMAARVRQGMEEGALGLSTGLEYDPGFYSSTEEVIELARVAAAFDGIYMSHMRDEEEGVMGAIDEAIRIGREARIPVQISHIKMGNAAVWGRALEAIERLARARATGVDIRADQYPYQAWQSSLSIVVRSRRFTDPEAVAEGLAALGGAERLQIVNYPPDRSVEGMRLSEIAAREGVTPVEMYIEMMRNGGAGVIGHTMSQEDVDTFVTSPLVMTASDGGVGSAHPRGAGAFARVLAYYVRERGLLSLERAIERGTADPADRLGLTDRGRIRPGAIADLVAFDPRAVQDRSTFTSPVTPATGVVYTWVAGELVWESGETTGARPGGNLRGPGAARQRPESD